MSDILLSQAAPDQARPRRSLRSIVRVLLWTLFLLTCYVLAWNCIASNTRYRADCRAQIAKQEGMVERCGRRVREINEFLSKRPLTRHEIEAKYNGGCPFELERHGELQVASWIDPDSSAELGAKFKDDVCVGHSYHYSTSSAMERYPAPNRDDYQGRSAVICRWITELVPGIWVLMVLCTALGARYRRPLPNCSWPRRSFVRSLRP